MNRRLWSCMKFQKVLIIHSWCYQGVRFTRTGAWLKDWSNMEVTADLEKRSFRGGVGNKITLAYSRKTMTLLIFLLPSAVVEAASGLEWSQFPGIFHRVTWSGQPCSINKTFLREKVCLDVYELKGKRQRTERWEQYSRTQAVMKAHLSFMSPKWDQLVLSCVFSHCTTWIQRGQS